MSIGITEIVILAIIALVVMGPEKFPDFAKIVIRTVRDLRGYMDDVKSEMAKELRPVQKELNDLSRRDVKSYLNYDAPKSSTASSGSSAKPGTPAKDRTNAQNIVDPTLVEESSTYKYQSPDFEQVVPAEDVSKPEPPNTEAPRPESSKSESKEPPKPAHRADQEEFPD